MTTVVHPDGTQHTIADPSVRSGRRIVTRLRLADGSTVPIELRATRDGWMQAITADDQPIRHCRKGHAILPGATYIDSRGYQQCVICKRIRKNKASKRYAPKWYRQNRERIKYNRRQRYQQQHIKQQKGK